MHLLLTGATGSIGRRLVLDRLERGDRLTVISRDGAAARRLFAADANPNIQVIQGDCTAPGPWQQAVDGVDAVVHMAGAGIGDRRWTTAYKKLIVDSRLDSTHQVVMAIESARRRPTVFVSTAAVGIYGDCGDRELTESSPPGTGFLADLCVRWEAEALLAANLGVRTVTPRLGIVLDERGGALRQIVPIFRRFIGGPLGSGRQYFPWIHWRDVVGLFDLALRDPRAHGALNVTAPNPVTNREFSNALGAALGRPSFMPAPTFVLHLVKGELAGSLVSSQRAVPAAALAMGYRFVFAEIGAALRATVSGEARSAVGAAAVGIAATARPGGLQGNGAPSIAAARAPGNGAERFLDAASGGPRGAASAPGEAGDDPHRSSGGATGHAAGRAAGREAAHGGGRAAAPARVRLLAVDVDGTLLHTNGRLTDPVIAALRRAERAGVVVVLATARSPRMLREIVKVVRLEGPTINCNGAIIWNPVDERAQYHEALSSEVASAVVAAARLADPDVVVEIDLLDRCHTDRIDKALQLQVSQFVQPDSVGPLESVLNGPITRLNLVAPPERLARVIEVVQREFWVSRQVALFLSHPCLAQVTAPLVDKGIALQRIARRIRCAREDVMAIGDAANDLGMLEWSGFGVAMANAGASVKALADAIAPSNDDNGVAWAVERWVTSREPGATGPVRPEA